MLFLYSIQMVLFLSAYNILLISEVFKYLTEFLLGAKAPIIYVCIVIKCRFMKLKSGNKYHLLYVSEALYFFNCRLQH